jgi:hypothetical protein
VHVEPTDDGRIHVDGVELPPDGDHALTLFTFVVQPPARRRDREATLARLQRWCDGEGICDVLTLATPEPVLTLLHEGDALVVTMEEA